MELIDRLEKMRRLSKEEWVRLLDLYDEGRISVEDVYERAREITRAHFGNKVYIRGLIEVSNYCKNDCYYCGIRKSNREVSRYHLTPEEIWSCCDAGYPLGFRTFVLQGGEDLSYSDDELCEIVAGIKARYPDCAITLSLGEKTKESYQAYFDAGADRYLLRHETADLGHYRYLHPASMSLTERKQCLWDLKEIGYQVGTGFMVGSPGQENRHLAEDLIFIQELQPHMVGIGPFIPHSQTPFGNATGGSVEKTVFLLALIRLLLPEALLPATTALGTASVGGREKGVLAGANVVMPNLSPGAVREKYELYDNKLFTGVESAEHIESLNENMKQIGYEVSVTRGDCPLWP